MSDYTTIAEALAAIQSLVPLMVEKGVVMPSSEVHLGALDQVVWLNYGAKGAQVNPDRRTQYVTFRGDTIREAVDEARTAIMALPSPEKAAIARFQSKIAKAVDEGRDDGIPDEYTAPVSAVVHTIHENLLEGPKAAAE